MADFAERERFERAMRRALGKVFSGTAGELAQRLGDPPDAAALPASFWRELRQEMGGALQPLVEQVYVASARQLGSDAPIGVDWGLVNQSAADWAKGYTFDLVKGVADNSAAKLQRAVARYYEDGLTQGDLRGLLAPIFGPVRARMIAVTEVTRASAQGELEIARQAKEAGYEMVAVWQTNNDDLVCPVCGPRNGKPQGEAWDEPPPAHVNCRCWVNHEIPGLGAVEGGQAQQAAQTAASTVQPPAPQVGQFATLDEAAVWARQTYPGKTFEFDGAHIDTINPTLKAFHDLAQQYPEVAARIEYIGTKPAGYPDYFQKKPLVWAFATQDGKTIAINPAYYGDPAKFQRGLDNSEKSGFHPKGANSFASVLVHEFGHQMHNWMLAQNWAFVEKGVDSSGVGLVGDTTRMFMKILQRMRPKVSNYARQNDRETWAENFTAMYFTPEAEQKKSTKRLSAFIDFIFGAERNAQYEWLFDMPIADRAAARAALFKLVKPFGFKP